MPDLHEDVPGRKRVGGGGDKDASAEGLCLRHHGAQVGNVDHGRAACRVNGEKL